ncbi:LiaF domain-containing protein [Pseudidiomarina terrestris]|uniref:DUF1707 and DUF2154 domain-containing protein n=1 Tax=Pseudidiomarina terrestris TaxID=2820060 RepID=A0AAW7QYE6_9GAMM|nr:MULTISPECIES: LiaF domain-containing protein [unclassified Pseudidiomarina]MDN7125182.1 DUF1707 and DUF2154 domain-containing protein [Pseudidiomarina sp. 1APP75-32.1]MDN7127415.1 DUF1707 and DUF2154 domain-containing protein [Pseudidiomarina sp. 1APR75-33.1]MDN7129943.1 DUF1707 and DUF2154 domain-containing protein [Pseudidiomarina sp. 1APR75-15]MDN7136109.1 DUF1707 and DUF2154 domain-containing protein [Pseudidiomarina sp. 1ASP75-5]MDN7138366.1 DUF1707 and DUF2154 domain-containing protei
MPVKLEDRPLEQVREETVDKLIVNYSRAIISAEAFERRLDEAMAMDSNQQLVELVADLPLEADPGYDDSKERSFTPNYAAANTKSEHGETDDKLISILGSNVREGQWLVPKKIVVVDVLGSAKIDFTDAVFQHQHVEIHVSNVLGSLEVFVPENVNVTSRMFNIIGSAENHAPSMGSRQAPQITITGWTLLGSVEVSVKRTMKEKLVAFANSMRETFGMEKQ